MLRAAGIAFVLMVCSSSVAAQERADIDPSNPTNLYTNVDFNFELQDHPGDGDLYGLNIIAAVAFNDFNRLDIELPIHRTAFIESENKTGLGDIRLRYFWVGYKKDDARFHAAGVSVDTFLPTGDPTPAMAPGACSLLPASPSASASLIGWICFRSSATSTRSAREGGSRGGRITAAHRCLQARSRATKQTPAASASRSSP